MQKPADLCESEVTLEYMEIPDYNHLPYPRLYSKTLHQKNLEVGRVLPFSLSLGFLTLRGMYNT